MDLKVRKHILTLAPYELHKKLINNYVLTQRGSTSLLKRDSSKDKTDYDIIQEHHKFLWDEGSEPKSWEENLAKKYYDKLFKEYCICDLTKFKENKVAMRWQTESELCLGKGQFMCGEKHCNEKNHLRTWEVNFGYIEQEEKKNALVKLRLCIKHSEMLNYKNKRKEIKSSYKNKQKRKHQEDSGNGKQTKKDKECDGETSKEKDEDEIEKNDSKEKEDEEDIGNVWSQPIIEEEKSRDKDFENYLDQLFM